MQELPPKNAESLRLGDAESLRPRRLSHEEARQEQRVYWAAKSIPERLAASAALTRRLLELRGIKCDEQQADFTPSRVRRQRS